MTLQPSRPNPPGGGGNRPNQGGGNNPGNRPPQQGGPSNRPPSGPNPSNRPPQPGGPGVNRPPQPGGPGANRPPFPGGGGSRPPFPGGGGSRPPGGNVRTPYPNRHQLPPEHRINEHIRAVEVRLVGDNLTEISESIGQPVETGIYPTPKVLRWAEEIGLDLVEISPNAVPPVVRIIDYNKFLYQKKKKEKEMKANAAKVELKEIRFGPETGDHDFEFKVRHAKNFLSEGNKVKAYVQFRGRAIVFKERGELLLLRFLKELEDYGTAEQLPRMDGKRMMVILTPKKGKKKED